MSADTEEQEQEQTASFPGMAIERLSGTFTRGAAPSMFSVEFSRLPQTPIPDTGDFIFGIVDGNQVTLTNARVLELYEDDNAQDVTGSATIVDRRWAWAYKPKLRVTLNRRDDEGNLIGAASEQVNLQDICTGILTGIGEVGFDVAAVPTNLFPFVDADYDEPMPLLEKLLEDAGFFIVYDFKMDIVRIVRNGVGLTEFKGVVLGSQLQVRENPIPEEVQVITGSTHVEVKDIDLLAVGVDTDGEIKPIDDLDFKPGPGWTPGSAKYFRDEGLKLQEKLFNDYVFRMYILPSTINIDGTDYDRTTAASMLLDTLVTTDTNESGEEVAQPPYAEGQHLTEKSMRDSSELAKATAESRVQANIRIDRRRECLIFSQRVFWRDLATKETTGATLKARLAFEVRVDDGRRVRPVAIEGGEIGLVSQERRPDLHPLVDADGVFINEALIEDEIEEMEPAIISKYTAKPVTPGTDSYSGIELVVPDGNISQVVYAMSFQQNVAPVTRINYGDTGADLSLPNPAIVAGWRDSAILERNDAKMLSTGYDKGRRNV